MKLWAWPGLVCLLVVAPAPALQLQPAPDRNDHSLQLMAGSVDTRQQSNLITAPPPIFDAGAHYVIQLDGPMTPVRHAALLEAGVVVGQYLPTHAYIAGLGAVAPQDLAGLGFVRWAGRFQNAWKLAPGLGLRPPPLGNELLEVQNYRDALASQGLIQVIVTLFDGEDLATTVALLAADPNVSVTGSSLIGEQGFVDAAVSQDQVADLADWPQIQYIEGAPILTPRNDTTSWILQSNVKGWTPIWDRGLQGQGMIGGLIDNLVAVGHCAFFDSNQIGPLHRKIVAYHGSLSTTPNSDHGTHTAGTFVGKQIDGDFRDGMAPEARLVYSFWSGSSSFFYSTLATAHTEGARVHSNSWGFDNTTAYTSWTMQIDRFSYDFEDSMVAFAVTNLSNLRTPENAKNVLAVGATWDANNQDLHSNGGAGPTSDGRRKPEVYAPGRNTISAIGLSCGYGGKTGTSMACPAVSGMGLLARQYFTEGWYPTGAPTVCDGFSPTGALLRGVLINSAQDMTGASTLGYPSNKEGWGRVLLDETLFFEGEDRGLYVDDVRNIAGLSTASEETYLVTVSSSSEPLRLTLVWTDPPAAVGTTFAPVNNLDLEVEGPGGLIYRGNFFLEEVGESAPGGVADVVNNVEQVHLLSPLVGEYTVRVRGTEVNVGTQGYGLVVTGSMRGRRVSEFFTIGPAGPLPQVLNANEPTPIQLLVERGFAAPDPATGRLHFSIDGQAFETEPLLQDGCNQFTAVLPAVNCPSSVEWFVSIDSTLGETALFPADAPATSSTAVAIDLEVVTVSDDFENDQGWRVEDSATLVDGSWERDVPIGGDIIRPLPLVDADGSGQCFLTDNVSGDSDVDGGVTRLVSPIYNLDGLDPTVVFSLWYDNNGNSDSPGDDVFRILVSSDGGEHFSVVREVAEPTPGWQVQQFRLLDYVDSSSRVVVAFEAEDIGALSVVEAAVDAFRIVVGSCLCDGDANGDLRVDAADLGFIGARFGCEVNAGNAACDGADVNGDEAVDAADVGYVQARLGTPCR